MMNKPRWRFRHVIFVLFSTVILTWWVFFMWNAANMEQPSCMPVGSLVYMHIMKTGGTSLANHLVCKCGQSDAFRCSVQRHDGTRMLKGDPMCIADGDAQSDATILSTHDEFHTVFGQFDDVSVHINTHSTSVSSPLPVVPNLKPHYQEADIITVLRHPVDRVLSLYSYVGLFYQNFKDIPFIDILRMYPQTNAELEVSPLLDLLKRDSPDDKHFWYVYKELTNRMTQVFGMVKQPWTLIVPVEDVQSEHFEQAVSSLQSPRMRVVGIMEQMDETFRLLEAVYPHFFANSATLCRRDGLLKHMHENQDAADTKLTRHTVNKELLNVIVLLNQYDLQLYATATKIFERQLEVYGVDMTT